MKVSTFEMVEKWHIMCDECEKEIHGTDYNTCPGCGKILCEDCIQVGEDIKCIGFKEYYCSKCITINKKYSAEIIKIQDEVKALVSPMWDLIDNLCDQHDRECRNAFIA